MKGCKFLSLLMTRGCGRLAAQEGTVSVLEYRQRELTFISKI